MEYFNYWSPIREAWVVKKSTTLEYVCEFPTPKEADDFCESANRDATVVTK